MQTGWRVGSLFNIPLFIDNSWFFIVLFITFSQGSDPSRVELLGTSGAWAVGFIYAMLLFGSVLLHELGHSLVAQSQGITVNSIKLFLFGGVASIERESKTPGGAFKVAAAGPAVSIALFVLLTLLGNTGSLPPVANGLVKEVAQINLILALFNLLPGLPLDGGQIFKAAVWKVTNSRTTGVKWAAKSGQVVGWTGLLLGAIAFFSTGSLFAALWPVLIGLFILRNAAAYNRMNTLQEGLAKLQTGDAAVRDFRVLDANMSLRQFADEYLLEDKESAPVYFASSDGRYRGMVTIEDLRQVERSEWEYRNLHSIARPLLEIPHVRENTPLTEAIRLLEEKQISRLTVLTPADAVAGTLDRGDIVRAVARQLKLPIAEPMIEKIKQEGVYPAGLQLGAIVQSIEQA
ncbi:peptidase, M50 family protein [Synechococcus sp. PCC 7335]|uniref:site-2 protease family protein n=1 Tax=Synechococcus sp. (strain ATCC 29403 / PCC 7335) TaxID=91464 RepID=UPI00017ED576|nr:site-2 protease family protein [Synechococcus sp. PCC 7335]EDX84134.1 peptidase, M50 family protein [Synechococcus sp. PCC 7335]